MSIIRGGDVNQIGGPPPRLALLRSFAFFSEPERLGLNGRIYREWDSILFEPVLWSRLELDSARLRLFWKRPSCLEDFLQLVRTVQRIDITIRHFSEQKAEDKHGDLFLIRSICLNLVHNRHLKEITLDCDSKVAWGYVRKFWRSYVGTTLRSLKISGHCCVEPQDFCLPNAQGLRCLKFSASSNGMQVLHDCISQTRYLESLECGISVTGRYAASDEFKYSPSNLNFLKIFHIYLNDQRMLGKHTALQELHSIVRASNSLPCLEDLHIGTKFHVSNIALDLPALANRTLKKCELTGFIPPFGPLPYLAHLALNFDFGFDRRVPERWNILTETVMSRIASANVDSGTMPHLIGFQLLFTIDTKISGSSLLDLECWEIFRGQILLEHPQMQCVSFHLHEV
mmetsp:Transcript_33714/g.55020  ORF Transcript_33714/g.55020 Transcript_33714/m.55020 type:complete len:399 (-) Transcript_33714:220-1416(-)